MTNTDFERAFGAAPQGFENAILRGLKQNKGRAVMRTSRRALLIAALVAVLAFSAAFAATNGFGLLNLLGQRFDTPEAAVELLQTPAPEAASRPLDRVTATIEQAITDGEKVYFTVRIAPKQGEKLLLMSEQEAPSYRVADHEAYDDKEITFRELAERDGKHMQYAYPYIGWCGDYETYSSEYLGEERDGDALVFARAIDCLPDEDGKVRLSVRVKNYDIDADIATRKASETTLTATLENTGELKAYRWKNPAKIKALGIQLTEVRVTDSAMTRSVEVRYKQLKGLDEAGAAKAGEASLQCFDDEGRMIDTVFGGTSQRQGDTVVDWMALPASGADHITFGTPIWTDNWDETFGEHLVRLDLKDAEKLDIQSMLEKRRKQLKAEAEESAKTIADYEREASATPKPRPTALPQIAATGCEIPLLRNYDTAYAGVREQLEAIAMPVNRSVKGKSAKLTIDQLVMSDRRILVFYTIKSQKKIQRDEEVSLKGWSRKVAKLPYFDITFEGENPEATERNFRSAFDCEQFWLDDYTVTGYALADTYEPSVSVPEKSWMTIKARQFGGGLTMDVEMDRTAAAAACVDLAVDAVAPLEDYPHLGVTVKHVSMSPIMNELWIEEDMIGREGTEFLILDDKGESLTVEGRTGMSPPTDPEHPEKVTARVTFVGGLDSETLTLVPIKGLWTEASFRKVEHVPLDAELPYTIEHGPGLKTVIYEIDLNTNGLKVRYKTDLPSRRTMALVKSEQTLDHEDEPDCGSYPGPRLDYGTGEWVYEVHWVPKKGAKDGERVPKKMIEGLKYLRLDGGVCAANVEDGVVIKVR